MLKDPKFVPGFEGEKIEDGVFISAFPFNFHHTLTPSPTFEQEYDFLGRYVSTYGVADNVEQIKNHYLPLLDNSKNYCIGISIVKKSEQESWGGWRWHKWGEYIGEQNPQCEYLYNEPEIEEVMVYSIILLEE